MNTGDLLTVKEFAAAAGVSTQRIYKAMKTTLQPYVANTGNGLTMLKANGLREFGLQPRVASDTTRLIDTQAAEIESLKAQLQGDTQPGGDQSEAGNSSTANAPDQSEGTPKRGLFARIRAALSKSPLPLPCRVKVTIW